MILTPAQLTDFTRKHRSDGQRRELLHLGVPFKVRRDKSLVVLLRDVEQSGVVVVRREPELHL
jgi:hypothetical protein